jgi:poly(ADP-ribose) glycohydrolase ARH3
MNTKTLSDRCRGGLLGVALGDALGAPFEGRARVGADAYERWAAAPEPLRWTDDTAMTIGVAESLIACGGVDGAHMAGVFAEHHDAEPWRGYGPGPPRIFAALRAGARWDEPATALFEGGSFGNGAAMRVAPVGLYAAGDPARAADLARETARITHAHPLGRDGAAVQAAAVAWLAGGGTPAGLLDAVADVAETAQFRQRLAVVDGLAPDASVRAVVAALGHGVAALESVPAALHAFLRAADDVPSTIRGAVLLGGDADTIAAMAGALAGASLGVGALPQGWLARLEAADRLTALADQLAAAIGP